MFELIWKVGKVPNEWNIGIIIPIYKKGDRCDVKNYRGITLMVVASKILERVILNRIWKEREKRCRESQAGFRVGRSCSEQIFTLRKILQSRSEWNLPIIAVALDFAVAYDSVDREAVLTKLEMEGMGVKTLKVLRAMMTNTIAKVRIGKEFSKEFKTTKGVKQGSILSPTIFVALMDWLLEKALDSIEGVRVSDSKYIFDLDYADDVLLLVKTLSEAQKAVDRVAEFGSKVGMKLNEKKTVWIARNIDEGELRVNGSEIAQSETIVYLGSEIDSCGGLGMEINRRLSSANAKFWCLKNLWKNKAVMLKTKVRVYSAIVRSTLLYGAETWPIKTSDTYKIAVFDRARLRWIAGISRLEKISNSRLASLTELPDVEQVITRNRWKWLGHVLRMNDSRWPLIALCGDVSDEQGAKRLVGAPKKSWTQLVVKEGWERLDWKKIGVRKPLWKCWKDGAWLMILKDIAMDRSKWRIVVNSIVSSYTQTDVSLLAVAARPAIKQ